MSIDAAQVPHTGDRQQKHRNSPEIRGIFKLVLRKILAKYILSYFNEDDMQF